MTPAKLLLVSSVFMLLALAVSAQTPPSKRNLTIDDYFRVKGVSDPQISPDGKWVAYAVETASLKDDKNHRQIWMISTSGGERSG